MKGKKVSWCKSFTNYPLMVSIYDAENCSIKTDQNSLLGVSGRGGGSSYMCKRLCKIETIVFLALTLRMNSKTSAG